MIGVGVGKERRVQALYPLPQALDTEVRRGIDYKMGVRRADQEGGPGAMIPGIGGSADNAVATDDRNPLGGSCAKKGEFQ